MNPIKAISFYTKTRLSCRNQVVIADNILFYEIVTEDEQVAGRNYTKDKIDTMKLWARKNGFTIADRFLLLPLAENQSRDPEDICTWLNSISPDVSFRAILPRKNEETFTSYYTGQLPELAGKRGYAVLEGVHRAANRSATFTATKLIDTFDTHREARGLLHQLSADKSYHTFQSNAMEIRLTGDSGKDRPDYALLKLDEEA